MNKREEKVEIRTDSGGCTELWAASQSIKTEQGFRVSPFFFFFSYYVSIKPTGKICALSSCYAVVQLVIAASYSFSSS